MSGETSKKKEMTELQYKLKPIFFRLMTTENKLTTSKPSSLTNSVTKDENLTGAARKPQVNPSYLKIGLWRSFLLMVTYSSI